MEIRWKRRELIEANVIVLLRGCVGEMTGSRYTFIVPRDGRFGSKVGQIGPKWDKSGAFSDQISVHLARQMH